MTFLSEPRISPAPGGDQLWRLDDALIYQCAELGRFTVKPGAITDGASIPRPLWPLLGSPMRDGRVLRAAIVHDQLYCTVGIDGRLTRAQCDALFRRALQCAGVPLLKAWVYWLGVRLGGWVGWRNYAKHTERIKQQLALIELESANNIPTGIRLGG